MLGGRLRGGDQTIVHDQAEIRPFKQIRRQHDLAAFARPFAPELAHGADVRAGVVGKRELQRSDSELGHAGTCWEMQWKLPPPVKMWSALSPIATRSGN